MSSIQQGLLGELKAEEGKLGERYDEYREARSSYEVAGKKYAAVRDMVIQELGYNPYGVEQFPWPKGKSLSSRIGIGGFRFLYMRPGDAVAKVLKEATDPMTFEEINDQLEIGELRITLRRVNAAL